LAVERKTLVHASFLVKISHIRMVWPVPLKIKFRKLGKNVCPSSSSKLNQGYTLDHHTCTQAPSHPTDTRARASLYPHKSETVNRPHTLTGRCGWEGRSIVFQSKRVPCLTHHAPPHHRNGNTKTKQKHGRERGPTNQTTTII
jgi:hypothetical protein